MAYKILSRFYAHSDQMGEAYVIVSDNDKVDTKFDIGQKIDIQRINNEVDNARKSD